jgi:hypothetical protein
MTDPGPWDTVFATGHRTVPAAGREWTRDKLMRCARWLATERGTRVGISGMARCSDLWWAEAVLHAGLDLWAYIPFEEQASRWSRRDRADWAALRKAATDERVIGQLNSDGSNRTALLWQRNDAMLAAGHAAVAVWVSTEFRGGTYGCLRKAARRGLPGVHLDPAACGIRMRLPTLAELTPHPAPARL